MNQKNLKVRKQCFVYFQDELKVSNDVNTSLCRTRLKKEARGKTLTLFSKNLTYCVSFGGYSFYTDKMGMST